MDKLLIGKIRDLNHSIKEHIHSSCRKHDKIKNYTQARIMIYLFDNDGKDIYQKDIGEFLKMKKSSITEHLDYLEKEKLIVRCLDEKDKRKNRISISKEAKKNKDYLDKMIIKTNNEVIKGISDKDLKTFEKVIDQMQMNMKGIR